MAGGSVHTMAAQFSPASLQQIDQILPKYPTTMAACLPVLWVAQEQFGWISRDVMELVAETLDLPLSHVYGVVTFYTMFNEQPRGTFHVQVCTNVACMLLDAYDVLRRFEQQLGVRCGETTPDKLFTLNEVECLAACGSAPCVQINDEYREPVRPEEVAELVAQLRRAAAQVADGPGDDPIPAKAAASGRLSTPDAGGVG